MIDAKRHHRLCLWREGGSMNRIDNIKSVIEGLYQKNPEIHIAVNRVHPRLTVEESPATIVGVYKNIFQVEARENRKRPTVYSLQYGDVLSGQVTIRELGDA